MLGGDAGSALGTLSGIASSGFSMDKVGSLVSMFMGFAKSNAGEGVVSKLLSQVPELSKLSE